MTRSNQKAPSARVVFNKTIRAKAHAEGTTFAAAREAMRVPRHAIGMEATPMGPLRIDPNHHKASPSPRGRGNPDYRSKAFVSAPQVDDSDGKLKLTDEDIYDFRVDFVDSPEFPDGEPPVRSFSLYDLAKPAKTRGPAKAFEVVPRVRNVVVLSEAEDDDLGSFYVPSTCGDDEDWERISELDTEDKKQTYSAVLRAASDT
ncbi:hypothetical protein CVT24_001941 [Panaeolus cyanescens]|uniref:Uncharacterized protein n=1 Tax=Panaeolus cyanescens TaxID=181874 RepID=A0A409YHS0_9AGAR|nr:hypothetical protein CVT24_001941 [Panaeolus cyanescens]